MFKEIRNLAINRVEKSTEIKEKLYFNSYKSFYYFIYFFGYKRQCMKQNQVIFHFSNTNITFDALIVCLNQWKL